MGNVLHVIFRYFIDTRVGVVRVERLLLYKDDATNVLSSIAYRSAQWILCIVYRTMRCVSRYTGAPVYCSNLTDRTTWWFVF